jgi:uncharacterized Fe-S cluster-containing radical SAM superfamily protein
MNTINTDDFSLKLRNKGINIEKKSILITNYLGSEQEKDLTEPANCNGYGRIRHFKLKSGSKDWPQNPLPIIPANKHLGLPHSTELEAQIFQNAICNWRCWYCYVDFKLLIGDSRYSSFLKCEELLDLYLAEEKKPVMIDLSGGQPDLTPEWIPWMMEAIIDRKLESKIFLWSDDNLSNDYFWKYLTSDQISMIENYKMYSRVCCFKGIDENSFQINTKADGKLFNRQFELFNRMNELNIDLYAYITLISPLTTNFSKVIPEFLDKIQKIDEIFPLRIVPLEIFEFTPMLGRNKPNDLIDGQKEAIKIWQKEMESRFTKVQLKTLISDVYDN